MDTKTTWIVAVIIFFATGTDAHVVQVKEGPRDRAVLFGRIAELACHIHHARSKPDHIVQWVANSKRTGFGKQVSYNERITVRDIPNKFSISTALPYNLLIQNVDMDDAGKYTCNNVRIGKPIGGLDPQLIVLALDQNTIVKEVPQDRAVLFGENVELTCHIDPMASDGNHFVQWMSNSLRTGNGRQISINDRVTTTIDLPNKFSIRTDRPYNLIIHNANMNDSGKYSCHNLGERVSIGEIDPVVVVLAPASCPMLAVSTFKEHEIINYTWSVRYAGNRDESQKPTITWTLNDIQQNAVADETTKGVFKSTITMAAASVDDQKELSCSFSVLNVQEICSTRLDIRSRKPHDEAGITDRISNMQSNNTDIYKSCATDSLNRYGKCRKQVDLTVVQTMRLHPFFKSIMKTLNYDT